MSTKNITVPDIGDIDEVEVIEILVSVGDTVQAEDSLITVESDKASMEIPCSDSGTVKEIKVSIGDTVKEGSVVIVLDAADSAAAAPAAEAAPEPAPVAAPAAAAPAPAEAASAAPAPVAAGPKEIVVPDIGDFDSVEIIELLVAVGDRVEVEDSLITVESDKASMEIPSSDAGTVKEIKVSIGDNIAKGSVVLILDADAPAQEAAPAPAAAPAAPTPAPEAPKAAPTPAAAPTPKPSPTANIDEESFKRAYASPSVRRLARELGVDLGKVTGTGRKQRIVKSDLFEHVKSVMTSPAPAAQPSGNALGVAPMPEIDFSQWGEVETQALTKINKLTGQFLHRNYLTAIHVTQFDEADITEMEVFRKQVAKEREREGIKITPLAFVIQAVAAALKAFPRFNSSLDASGENLILKKYINIGIAVNTPDGLVVPVINDADKKSLIELSNEIRELAGKAKDKKLKPSDMQGACFTISSLGGVGGTSFTPIINLPEVAILGVSNSKVSPVWNGKEFEPRTMLPLSLSYDHRVIDGVAGAQFTSYLSNMLSDIRRLLV
ncbi:dihydrolipoyllysine-residue acetyltransferase [Leucothrix sargassi]|nr:dihydrolipoyllysine-residue acetyltransferase [Leucothrix sargassi]